MHELVVVVSWINVVAFLALAGISGRQFRMRRDPAAGWAALAFAALAVVVVLGRIVPTHPHGLGEGFLQRLDIAVLLLFPYSLYRFTIAFGQPSPRIYRLLTVATAALVIWTFALPDIPASGEPWPADFVVYIVAFFVHWVAFSAAASVRLWRGAALQPSVARRRMRLLATSSALLALALILVAAAANNDSPSAAVAQLLGLVSALGFLLGLAPPAIVRMAWRRPEQDRLQNALQDLVALARSRDDIVARVLPPASGLVGARASELRDDEGRLIGAYSQADEGDTPVDVPAGRYALVVWTNPYAPFFGGEELALLRTLGALTGIALDRVRLYEQEHAARIQLERANQLQANFVALAAHELRTPVTTIHGFVQTLHHLGERLNDEQRVELEKALVQQTSRMASLVEQLLDLSRLDADAIEIAPTPTLLHDRLAVIVRDAAGPRIDAVRLDVDPSLEAPVDPEAFDRIVTNLVTNALKYGEPPVVVRAHQQDRHLRLSVEDHGRGIDPAFVPDLFERFSRSEHSRGHAGGTGLGLAIARSYARAHAGELRYEPLEPHGSRFELVIPVEP